MHKILPFIVVAILLISIMAFYQRNTKDASEGAAGGHLEQISFFHYFSGALSGGIDEMVTAVNSNSPERAVLTSGLDHEAFKSMIHTSLDRGNPPELFSYWAGERVQQLVGKDQLMPIDDFWSRENLSADFSATIIESAVTYNGKKYLLPITQHIVVFFYNKKIFDSLGIVPPQSWQDFLQLCSALKHHGLIPLALGARERWPAQFWFDYLLLRTAGPDFRKKLMHGEQSYTDKEVRQAYRMWSELLLENYFNADANQLDWAEATDLVRQGEAAMTLMGTWATQLLEKPPFQLQPELDYDFFPFPTIYQDIPHVSVGPIDGIILSRESENHAFAKEVLGYFAGQQAQKLMSTGSGAIAPNYRVSDEFYSPFKQRLKKEIERSVEWAFNYDLATPHGIADKGMDSFNELIEFPRQYEAILEHLQQEIETGNTNLLR